MTPPARQDEAEAAQTAHNPMTKWQLAGDPAGSAPWPKPDGTLLRRARTFDATLPTPAHGMSASVPASGASGSLPGMVAPRVAARGAPDPGA
jgi:hypothetical protein